MAKDLYHDNFRKALEKDGWAITHDPYPLRVGRIGYEVDFGAEKLIAAEKGNEKIAVELKSFSGPSDVNEFHRAVGQFNDYFVALKSSNPVECFSWACLKMSGRIFFRNLSYRNHSIG